MRRTVKLVPLLICASLTLAFAQDDSIFESSGPIVQEAEDATTKPTDRLLSGDALTIGGAFDLAAEALLVPGTEESFSVGLTDLYTTLLLDARPNDDFRAFLKGDVSYGADTGVSLALSELFADFDVDNRVFVRAGKQTVNWGVGTFFSPANLINLDEIDPEDPTAELSGPVSVKAQLPIGTDNLTGYLILGDIDEGFATSGAARYEFLLEGYEVTTGAIAEENGHFAVMMTGTGSIADVTVFAEAVLEGNSDKVFVVKNPTSPSGLATSTSNSLFFSGTLGGRYSTSTEDDRYTLSVSAQYYFNGLGYADTQVLTDNPGAVGALLGSGDLTLSDLQGRGQHYTALNLSSPDFAKTDLTPSVFWLSNLSDSSGLVSANVRYSGIDFFTPSLEYRANYGAPGAEYSPNSPNGFRQSISLAFSVTGAF